MKNTNCSLSSLLLLARSCLTTCRQALLLLSIRAVFWPTAVAAEPDGRDDRWYRRPLWRSRWQPATPALAYCSPFSVWSVGRAVNLAAAIAH